MKQILTRALRVVLVALLAAVAPILHAQGSWPSRPVRLIVPFPVGGNTDALARIVAEELASRIGQPVVVENRAGAGGTLGADVVAKAAPDGHTLLLGTSADQINAPFLYPKLPYAPLTDLTVAGVVARDPILLLAGPTSPAMSVKELIAYARARPDAVSFASSGVGTTGHLAGALLQQVADLKLNHIPYKGSAPAVADVMGGHVHLLFASPISVAGHVRSGALKALGIASSQRSPLDPTVPTLRENGLSVEISTLYLLMAPAGTSQPILQRLNGELQAILGEQRTVQRIQALGAEPVTGSLASASDLLAGERARWKTVIQNAKITVN